MTQVSILLNDCVLYFNVYFSHRGFPGGNGNVVMSLPAYAEDLRDAGSTPGLRRSPGKGHSNPLQYSCLENPLDRGAWQAAVHGVTKSWTWLSDFHSSLSHTGRMRCPMDYRSCHIGAVGLAGMVVGHWLIEQKRAGKAESSPAVPRIQPATSPNQESGELSLVWCIGQVEIVKSYKRAPYIFFQVIETRPCTSQSFLKNCSVS